MSEAEYLPPCSLAEFTVHIIQNPISNQGTERITDQATARKHSGAQAEFLPLVPFRQQEKRAGEESGLDESQEEPGHQCADETGGNAGQDRNHA